MMLNILLSTFIRKIIKYLKSLYKNIKQKYSFVADDKKENMITNRDVDSPDTIVSSSSPECVIPEFMHRFPGLRLIEEESDEEAEWLKRVSPVIPLISPIPIRLKPTYLKDSAKQDKENLGIPKYIYLFLFIIIYFYLSLYILGYYLLLYQIFFYNII